MSVIDLKRGSFFKYSLQSMQPMQKDIQVSVPSLDLNSGKAPIGRWQVDINKIKIYVSDTENPHGPIVVDQELCLVDGHMSLINNRDRDFGFKYVTVDVVNYPKHVGKIKLKDKKIAILLLSDVKVNKDKLICFDELANQEFAHEIKRNGILTPISVDKDYRIIDGHRRYRAAMTAGFKTIPAYVMDQPFPATGQMFVGNEKVEYSLVEKSHPSTRGKVRCLEPECKVWIRVKENQNASRWFCHNHKLVEKKWDGSPGSPFYFQTRGYEDFPLVDRDGDPIWIMKDYSVVKISKMEDSHLTNTLVFLETNAKRRCELTGLPEEKWKSKAGIRYPYLLEEAKLRDEALKCGCDDGIVQLEIVDPNTLTKATETSICNNCTRGENRRKAKQLAIHLQKDAEKRKTKLTAQIATMMVVALLAGGSFTGGMTFINYVLNYLNLK